jgi:hypothetical protein
MDLFLTLLPAILPFLGLLAVVLFRFRSQPPPPSDPTPWIKIDLSEESRLIQAAKEKEFRAQEEKVREKEAVVMTLDAKVEEIQEKIKTDQAAVGDDLDKLTNHMREVGRRM